MLDWQAIKLFAWPRIDSTYKSQRLQKKFFHLATSSMPVQFVQFIIQSIYVKTH